MNPNNKFMQWAREVDDRARARDLANYHEPRFGVSYDAELSDGLTDDNPRVSEENLNPDSIG